VVERTSLGRGRSPRVRSSFPWEPNPQGPMTGWHGAQRRSGAKSISRAGRDVMGPRGSIHYG
jgi:hypothetical protein